ncbi:hypothetical protein ATCC90586_008137 [Pythium insidiosum]|nr:hypothetical protein ATCC90586_008137 [Pythium insidiosum]
MSGRRCVAGFESSIKPSNEASAVQDAGSKSGSTSQDVGIKPESQARNTDSNGVCHEDLQVVLVSGEDHAIKTIRVENPPSRAEELLELPVQSWESMLKDLKNKEVEQLCLVTELAAHSSTDDPDVAVKTQRELRDEAQSLDALKKAGNPMLPPDRGVRHEIDLVPGSKYCVTRQWLLPREQVEAINAFFEARRKAGHVRVSISPHSSPTFCVKKGIGGWRIVHAYNNIFICAHHEFLCNLRHLKDL